jgi:epoxyqueuosine reductase QueG
MVSISKLEEEVKSIARDNGAALVGISSRERLTGAPPSVDPEYVLPLTRSIISVAIPLDRKIIRDFLSKKEWLSHGNNRKNIYQKLYTISDSLTHFFREKGFEAVGIEANSVYRPEPGGTDAVNRVDMVPDFSHRYAAVACGLGWIGWSGNLMTPQFGSAVYLASILTSAELEADPILEDNPCEKCKLCTTVCPVEMISTRETVSVNIAGREYRYAKKKHNAQCIIGCGGYHSLEPNNKWSTWSPYRVDYPLSDDEAELIALSRQVRRADPDKQGSRSLLTVRDKCFDRDEVFIDTCGNCQLICWERREDREENRRLLVESGVVVLTQDGRREPETADQVTEVESNREVRVAIRRLHATTSNSWLSQALYKDARQKYFKIAN